MTAPKVLNQWGYAAKVESTYGTINACTVSDGILLKAVPTLDVPHWVNMGDRGVTPGGAPRQDAPNSGRWGGFKVVAEGIGSSSTQAYAAGVKPQLDVAILASGYTGTGSFTAGQENWLYTPAIQPTALTSVTTEVSLSGQLYRLFGAYADIDIAANGPVIPDWNFDFIGAMDLVTDATIPNFTSYPVMATIPMKADSITAKIGLFVGPTLVVKSFHFKEGRNHKNLRANQLGGFTSGMSGYSPGYRKPQLELVVERVPLAVASPWNTATTLNPYKLCEDAIPVILQVSVGATQYRKWHIFSGTGLTAGAPNPAAQAVLTDVKDTAEGPTATWTLTFDFFASTYGASDEHAILFN